ncbi:MAG: excinuclease ABC subunit UvrC [Bacillota bacterium]|jgi:excinuclease ABC subunit C|nr:excinuclease ABC subunit UvrC [Bacillota bacterium]NLV63310.1 excinuclease ABC subunit UvrC [Clostridiaceae bacterium]
MNKIKEILENIPSSSGVYLMKDKSGKIIYVGKAKVLKNRVRQYFQNTDQKDPKTRALVSRVNNIETITTKTEAEALILENTLIKMHRPRYNILLKDDKTYPYIRITAQDEFPRIEITRNICKDGSKYFGSYTKPSDIRKSIELLRKIYPIRTCKKKITGKNPQRPCLYYHIRLCSAPCAGKIDKESYNEIVKEVCRFLEGRHDEIIDRLEEKMKEYADGMEYEKAAAIRDKLVSIRNITAKQLVLSTKMEDRDLCALVRDKINSMVVVLFVRAGKLVGKNAGLLENTYDMSDAEVMETFVSQFYGNGREIPHEILVSHTVSNIEILQTWLRGLRGKSVKLMRPVRGEKKSQINMALKNAQEEFERYIKVSYAASKNREKSLAKLTEYLGLEEIPERIEAYDISNTGGQGMVGGMVVFRDGLPASDSYRKFAIKSVDSQNDYACMQEVLFRRLKRLHDSSADKSFIEKPDLILVDGGIGHVHAAKEILDEFGIDIPVLGMAKDNRHQTSMLVNDSVNIVLDSEPDLFNFISKIQHEVHRFAIKYHRQIRQKNQKKSQLDEIPGIGPAKKKLLLKEFGSLKRIRAATVEQLCQVKGINRKLADEIKRFLN